MARELMSLGPDRTNNFPVLPLLVVLHGDRERATVSADRWRAVAKQRGWAVLALQCPTVLGCKGSFWQWNGDPKWVLDQVAAVAHTASIDPAQIYLAGCAHAFEERWVSIYQILATKQTKPGRAALPLTREWMYPRT